MENTPLQSKLNELKLPAFRYFDTTESTNKDALQWSGENAPDFAMVLADHQSAGKGRMQRTWVTRPGVALAFSQIFIPNQKETASLHMFSPLAGIAVAEAIENLYNLSPRIKWPNDVLLYGKKVCGVLVEAFWVGKKIETVVMGVGINVFRGSAPADEEVMFPAACIEEYLEQPVDRFDLLRVVLERVAYWRPLLNSSKFLHAWQNRLAFVGEMVTVSHPGTKTQVGVVRGVDKWGNLCLELEPAGEIRISFGDVQLRKYDSDETVPG